MKNVLICEGYVINWRPMSVVESATFLSNQGLTEDIVGFVGETEVRGRRIIISTGVSLHVFRNSETEDIRLLVERNFGNVIDRILSELSDSGVKCEVVD